MGVKHGIYIKFRSDIQMINTSVMSIIEISLTKAWMNKAWKVNCLSYGKLAVTWSPAKNARGTDGRIQGRIKSIA